MKKCDDCAIGIGVEDAYIGGGLCFETEFCIDKLFSINCIIPFDFCPFCANKINWELLKEKRMNH